ncbi:MAG: M81 family metallopeptidase [Candidatus Bathyarchaeia archaeon]
MRIAVASFSHETCTFCPKETTIENFERGGVLYDEEVLEHNRGIPSYINGFITAAEEFEDVALIGTLAASSAWGGSSGSWLTEECFDRYSNGIAERIDQAGKIDGVLLALHGAMAARGYMKPEAEVVRRVRKVVGPETPIFVTLDLHANEDEELTQAADGVFILKTYPHVDSQEIGETACRGIIKTLGGELKPTMALEKPGVITPSVYQWTGEPPAKDIMDRAREWEEKEGVYSVSVAFGFAYADVPDVGATVVAVTDGDKGLAEEVAKDVSDYIWSLREPFAGKKLPKTEEGVEKAIKHAERGENPVIIADHSDRMGDSTWILAELIKQGASNFCVATISDQNAINAIKEQGDVGDVVTLKVGGYSPKYSGEPVEIIGKVEYLSDLEYKAVGPMSTGSVRDLGLSAVLGFGDNNHVVITPVLHQVLDNAIFPAVGLDFEDLDIIALKSRVHFRAFYEQVAGAIVVVDAPGLGPADLSQHDYHNIPEDLYPIGTFD